jgi:plastocyanin
MFRTAAAPLVTLVAAGVIAIAFGAFTAENAAKERKAEQAAGQAAARVAPTRALDASLGTATLTSSEYAFSAPEIDARPGKLTLTLANTGAIVHELVLLRSSASPGSLKVAASGRVSERASVGEVSETRSGAAAATTFTLKAGRYIYVCNLPGHYASGMRGRLVVK